MADVVGLRQHVDELFRRAGGLVPPSDVVLSWPAPNYVDPETHGDSGPIAVIVFLVLSIVVFIARMWARIVLAKNAGLDDWIMTAAILPLIGTTIAVVLACRTYGYQWHAWDQTPQTLISSRKAILAIEVFYLAATTLIKISILCFYKRITNGSITRTFKYCIWGFIAFVVAYFFAFTFIIVFGCSPIEGYWHYFDVSWRLTHELKCHNEGAIIVSVVVISTVQDFVICLLPIVLIWNLQIPKRQKVALCGIFGLGLLTCVCGIMRAYYSIYVYYYTFDITWYAWYGWIWTALEAQLGVICACAPALKGFFKRYFSLSAIRSGYSYNSGKLNSTGRRAPGTGKSSQGNSLGASQGESRWDPVPVPLNRIQVSKGTDIVVEDKDETASQGSTSSTRNLTALSATALPSMHRDPGDVLGSSPPTWAGNHTMITAFKEGREYEVEKHV